MNFIDIFSGAGGLSCGLEMAGMNCLLGIEKMRSACETFSLNHEKASVFQGDVKLLSKAELSQIVGRRRIHAVVGGPPCQGFSTVGTGDPDDSRNHLFVEFVRIVGDTEPHFIVIENVTGLLAKKNEKTLRACLRQIEKLGYKLDVKVLSARHYGVAETRRRTIIIGTNLDTEILFPRPTHNEESPVTLGEVLEDIADEHGLIHNHDLEAAGRLAAIDKKRLLHIPEGQGIRYRHDEAAFLPPSLRLGIDWDTIREGRLRQKKYFRLDRDEPSPTIMTQRQMYYHPVEPRHLTQREAARIQSFPNGFVFTGSLQSQWTQIGNAVAPLLGKAIGKSLLKMFRSSKSPAKKKTKVGRKTLSQLRERAFVYR